MENEPTVTQNSGVRCWNCGGWCPGNPTECFICGATQAQIVETEEREQEIADAENDDSVDGLFS